MKSTLKKRKKYIIAGLAFIFLLSLNFTIDLDKNNILNSEFMGVFTTTQASGPGDCADNGYKDWDETGTKGFVSCACHLISTATPENPCETSDDDEPIDDI